MAETESAVPCMNNVNSSVVCLKDIVREKDTHSGKTKTKAGDLDEKVIKKLLSALDMEDSDKEITSDEDEMGTMCFGIDDFDLDYMGLLYARQKEIEGEKDRPGHGHDKEQLTALNMENSEKDITSEGEMDSRGLTCLCGQNHLKYAEYMHQIKMQEIREKYLLTQPNTKPPTPEEWDMLIKKKEKKRFEMSLGDFWFSKYPPKDDSEYTLVWSDTDE